MDSDGITDEIFDEFIEYDVDDLDANHANKENQPNNPDTIKQPRVSKQQYALMDHFHKEHCEALVEGTIYDELWNDLVSKLNNMGPSVESVQEWKRKWVLRKYYHKQRLKHLPNSEKLSVDKPSHSDQANKSFSGHSSGFEKEVLEKLDVIINKLNEVIQIQSEPDKK